LTVQEALEAIRNITENDVTKLKLQSWFNIELGRIINRKPYWWRKKAFSFPTVASQALYNLSDKGTNPTSAMPDFVQMASPLYEFQGSQMVSELPFVADSLGILKMTQDPTQDTPTIFTVELGTTNVIRMSPIPNSVRTYVGVAYRGLLPNWTTPGDKEIPLIPAPFHYVALQSLERRAFFYLYGQKDPRAVIAAQAEQQCLADLDSYKAPSTLVAQEWRSGDVQDFIQSTH